MSSHRWHCKCQDEEWWQPWDAEIVKTAENCILAKLANLKPSYLKPTLMLPISIAFANKICVAKFPQ